MAQFRVTGPDGQTYDVNAPDDATDADVMEYVKANAEPSSVSPEAMAESLDPMLQSLNARGPSQEALRGPMTAGDATFAPDLTNHDRLIQGMKDPFVGAYQLGKNVMGDAQDLNTQIDLDEQMYQSRRAKAGKTGFDGVRLTGNIISSLPAFAAGMALPEMGALGAGVYAVGEGALLSALQPVTDSRRSFGVQKGGQAALGAVFGGATRAGLGGLGRVASPDVDPNLAYLRRWHVNPTVGQNIGPIAATAEDMTKSFNPGVSFGQRRAMRDYNVAAYNHVLAPIGETFEGQPGREAVRAVGDRLSAAYDDLVPNLRLVPDEQLQHELAEATSERALMSEAKQKQFDAILETQIPRGPLEGQPLKNIQSKLTKHIERFERSGDPDDQMIADGLSDVRTALMDNLARTSPEHAERLAGIDRGWANLVRLERASGGTGDGIFTPQQLLTAARSVDGSVRRRNIARGMGGDMQRLADSGIAVLGNKYPDSGTATRSLLGVGALGIGGGAINLPAAASYLSLVGLASLPYAPATQRALGSVINGNRGQYGPPIRRGIELLRGPGAGGAALLGAQER